MYCIIINGWIYRGSCSVSCLCKKQIGVFMHCVRRRRVQVKGVCVCTVNTGV